MVIMRLQGGLSIPPVNRESLTLSGPICKNTGLTKLFYPFSSTCWRSPLRILLFLKDVNSPGRLWTFYTHLHTFNSSYILHLHHSYILSIDRGFPAPLYSLIMASHSCHKWAQPKSGLGSPPSSKVLKFERKERSFYWPVICKCRPY